MEKDDIEKLKRLALEVMDEYIRNNPETVPTTFELCGEHFQIVYFPKIHRMFKHDPEWAEEQIKSIADVWHEGDMISATVALESDLEHG
jgi:hypothetical protein